MSAAFPSHEIAGYVLAGGRSSRMGVDKALLRLAGRPLVALAVEKLRRVCAAVSILSSRPELEEFGPLVEDVHTGCGPVGGVEAALLRERAPWCLFLAVDMPFVPAGLLEQWAGSVVKQPAARVAMFSVDGRLQPVVCLVHRELTPFVEEAVRRGEYRLLAVMEQAARELAALHAAAYEAMFLETVCAEAGWFANLNTPEEFREAELRWRGGEGSGEGAS